MKICFITYGCKVNQAEEQKWERIFRKRGYEITETKENADILIINTCAVTHKAEVQSRQAIMKAINSGIRTIVTGCCTSLSKHIKLDLDNVKFIPNIYKDKIISELKPISKNGHLKISRHRGIIKIQDGCDNYCTYCIVPYLRGKPRSIAVREILQEIKEYEEMGIKEIILSGINLGLYGKDLQGKSNLNILIKEILEKTSISKIRFSSIEINHINNEFLEIIGDRRICKHLHIPIQSGSDRILKLMNRPYDTYSYIKVFNEIVEKYPEISIGTDVIAGFPYETEEDFQNTIKIIENLNFSYLHVFPYSKRPFTKSSTYSEQISELIKKQRVKTLIELGNKKKEYYLKKFIGSELEVILERENQGCFTGTSDNYIKCIVEEEDLYPGKLIKVTVNKVKNFLVYGNVVKQE